MISEEEAKEEAKVLIITNKIAMILVFVGGALYAFGGKVFTGVSKILMSI